MKCHGQHLSIIHAKRDAIIERKMRALGGLTDKSHKRIKQLGVERRYLINGRDMDTASVLCDMISASNFIPMKHLKHIKIIKLGVYGKEGRWLTVLFWKVSGVTNKKLISSQKPFVVFAVDSHPL